MWVDLQSNRPTPSTVDAIITICGIAGKVEPSA
jgi:hypothetical protein